MNYISLELKAAQGPEPVSHPLSLTWTQMRCLFRKDCECQARLLMLKPQVSMVVQTSRDLSQIYLFQCLLLFMFWLF